MSTSDNISFAPGVDDRTLLAGFEPDGGPLSLTPRSVRDLLTMRGFGDLFPLEDGLQALATACRSGEPVSDVAVAERRDAVINVTVAKDAMEAYVSVSRPCGGRGLDKRSLVNALSAEWITEGLLPEALQRLLAEGYGTDVVVARGRPPEHGMDTRFEPLVAYEERRGRPKENEDGTVDFLDLGTVITVAVGQPLFRRHPATAGTPGVTVTGTVVPPRPGRDLPFGPLHPSVRQDDEDANLLVAAIAGLPRYGVNWVKVESILVLKDVDLTTGNVHFDGSVVVRGMVQAGLSIWAAGDVIVDGPVEGATIEAGGSIELRSGLVGQEAARIKAHGPIFARFIESATVETDNSLTVIDQILYSDVSAGGSVEVSGGRKPQIVGGHVRAALSIVTAVAGAPSGVSTVLQVGTDPYLQQEAETLAVTIARKRRKIEEVEKAIIHLKTKPGGGPAPAKHFEHLLQVLLTDRGEQEARLRDLESRLSLANDCAIVVRDQIFAGVRVRVSDQQQLVTYDIRGCSFRLRRGEIVISLT